MTHDKQGERRHDLDALRALAMLLGIVLHGGLSFTDCLLLIAPGQRRIECNRHHLLLCKT